MENPNGGFMKRLIKGGTLVTASETIKADLLVDGEKISMIAEVLQPEPDMQVINANGMMVLPGGVDAHVHLDMPMAGTVTADDHYSGTKAAAFGGTTFVIDFVSQDSDDWVLWWRRLFRRLLQKLRLILVST